MHKNLFYAYSPCWGIYIKSLLYFGSDDVKQHILVCIVLISYHTIKIFNFFVSTLHVNVKNNN